MSRKTTKVTGGDIGRVEQYNFLVDEAGKSAQFLAYQQTPPDLTLKVSEGRIFFGETLREYAGGNSPSFTAPVTNPRIDLLVLKSDGTLERIAGTEGAIPSAPAIPLDKYPICQVYNRVGQTSIKEVDDTVNGYIQKDLRVEIGYIKDIATKTYVNDSCPVGIILPYGGVDSPSGYLLCNGQAVSRETYADLFAVISTKYGVGDGSTTFNVPNLKGKIPLGLDPDDTPFNDRGKSGGAKTHTLIEAEMPSHIHTIPVRTGASPGNNVISTGSADPDTTRNSNSAGSGNPHNNLQPYLVVNFIVKY